MFNLNTSYYQKNQLPIIRYIAPQNNEYRQRSPIITKVLYPPQAKSTSQKQQQQIQMESQYIPQFQIHNTSQQSVSQQSHSFNQKNPKSPFNPNLIRRQISIQNRQTPSTEKKKEFHLQRVQQPALQTQQHLIQSEQDNYQLQSHPNQNQPQSQKLHQVNQLTKPNKQSFSNGKTTDLDQKIESQQLKQPQQLQKVANPYKKQEYHKTQPQVKENQLKQLTINYENNYIYRGQGYEPNTREGDGILTDQNENQVYDGQWKDNEYHGKGKLINVNPEEIEGPFDYQDLNAIENGWSWYEGDFSKGKMHGDGKLQLTNEEFFKGQFKDGLIEGKCEFTTINGQSFTGFWKKGVLTVIYD